MAQRHTHRRKPQRYKYLGGLSLGLLGFAALLIVFAQHMDIQVPGLAGEGNRLTSLVNVYTHRSATTTQYKNVIDTIAQSIPKTALLPITANAYYIAPLGEGENVISGFNNTFERNADKVVPIASITKLVTAIVATSLYDASTTEVIITPTALATEGKSGNFTKGQTFTIAEILRPLLMTSSNDAAEVLAEYHGRDRFIAEMNAWVKRIGADSTFFEDPSGLSPHNVSTAEDLNTIINFIYKNRPDLIAITHTKIYKARRMTWTNPTHFLNMSSYIGGKNGFTDEAGSTNVSLFNVKRNGTQIPYSVVLLKTKNRDKDTLTILKYLENLK